MDSPVSIATALIYPSDRGRAVRPDNVSSLAESLKAIGLKMPITVRPVARVSDGRDIDAFEIIAGRHRYEAAVKLHWQEIDCFVDRSDDATAQRKWFLSENIHRAELTVQERSEMIAEWVELAGGVSGQLAQKPLGGGKLGQLGPVSGGRPEGGISAATRELDLERTTVRRALKIAGMTDEAKAAAREAGLDDNQSALLEVAKEAGEKQADKIRELARRKQSRKEIADAEDAITQHDDAAVVADILATYIPASEHDRLVAALATARTKAIIRAFKIAVGDRVAA